jgi:uncharacterized membrane protein
VSGPFVLSSAWFASGSLELFFGRLHPLLVHLPLGLLAALVLCEFADLLAREHSPSSLRRFRRLLAFATALSAVVAAAAGLILGAEQGLQGKSYEQHRWLGLGFAVALALLAGLSLLDSLRGRILYRTALLGVLALAVPTGHLGGSMVHGPSYLSEHAPRWMPILGRAQSTRARSNTADDASVYVREVVPILEEHCVRCHGESKSSGQLRVDSPQALLASGKSGRPAVIPGNAAASELLRRLLLPPEHDERMPPIDEAPMPHEEILRVAHWIERGAAFAGTAHVASSTSKPERLDAGILEALAARGALLSPASDDGELWELSLQFVSDEDPLTLNEIAAHLRGLRVHDKLPIEALLGQSFPQLTLLDLRKSAGLTAAQIQRLAKQAPRLSTLILTGVALAPHSVPDLAALPQLRRVYIAATGLDDSSVLALRRARIDVVYPLDESPLPDRELWTLLSTSSEEILDNFTAHPARFAFDGNASSFWQTERTRKQVPYPHHLALDLGRSSSFNTLALRLPDAGRRGVPTLGEMYLSEDGQSWPEQPAWRGALFAGDADLGKELTIRFEDWIEARYVKLVFAEERHKRPSCAIAELELRGQ